MFKKRKLNPATLEELAKRYPQDIISDEDAKNIIGGTMYFDTYGTFIARVGSGDDIRICSGGAYSVNEVWSGSLQSYFEMQDLMGRLTWQDPNATANQIQQLQDEAMNQYRIGYGEFKEVTGIYGPAPGGNFKWYVDKNEDESDASKYRYVYVGPNQDGVPSGSGSYAGLNDYNYGNLAGSLLNVPDFMKYSQPISVYAPEIMERIKIANPELFGGSGGSGDGTGNVTGIM